MKQISSYRIFLYSVILQKFYEVEVSPQATLNHVLSVIVEEEADQCFYDFNNPVVIAYETHEFCDPDVTLSALHAQRNMLFLIY